jgi:hypothetical protein
MEDAWRGTGLQPNVTLVFIDAGDVARDSSCWVEIYLGIFGKIQSGVGRPVLPAASGFNLCACTPNAKRFRAATVTERTSGSSRSNRYQCLLPFGRGSVQTQNRSPSGSRHALSKSLDGPLVEAP